MTLLNSPTQVDLWVTRRLVITIGELAILGKGEGSQEQVKKEEKDELLNEEEFDNSDECLPKKSGVSGRNF